MYFRRVWIGCCLLGGFPVALAAQSYAALDHKVQLKMEHTNAAAVVLALKQQTPYTYIYDPEYLQRCTLPQVQFAGKRLADVLRFLDDRAPLDIAFRDNTIAIRQGVADKPAKEEEGKISGKIVDNKNEALPGVTVQVENGQGTVSQVDGSYELTLKPGKYTLIFRYISFNTRKVTDITVQPNRVTPLSVVLSPASSALKEVVVTGNYQRSSVEGLYAIQKNNAAITDGISADLIARTPDKNVGEVLKRVSGLSTLDNRYVVVRGLSERYNQAMLNGQIMPSTELNRKNFSFDIIPANIVENITVIKTITPEYSAEFGGGLVEVNTIDIPSRNFLNISAGGSINDNTTGKTFRSLQLEDRAEYWGRVPGSRKLMGTLYWKTSEEITTAFHAGGKDPRLLTNNWGVYEFNAQPSQNYRASLGHVFSLGGNRQIGITAAASYRHTLATQDVDMNWDGFLKPGVTGRRDTTAYSGKRYGFTTNLGGLLGVGYKTSGTKIGYQSIFLRSFDQQLLIGTGFDDQQQAMMLGFYDFTTQTDLWQQQLRGEHALGKKGIKLKWLGSYVHLDRYKPDNHVLKGGLMNNGNLKSNEFNINEVRAPISQGALRWWNRALENGYNWDAALSVPFRLNAGGRVLSNTFKAGYAGWSKKRLFYVVNFSAIPVPGEEYITLANKFDPGNGAKVEISSFSDDFNRTASLHAVYGMFDNKLGDKLRLVWGVRAEYYDINKVNALLDTLFKKINQDRNGQFDYSALLSQEKKWNIFPSANLTYSLTPAMNLRLAYAKSIIRPDLRELSFFHEYDFEIGGQYDSRLVRSTILHHGDFRYEWYPGSGEILSLSLFYKYIKQPMEIYEFQYPIFNLLNSKSAKNYGLEMEVRKSLRFTKVPCLRDITLYANFTMLDARLTPMKVAYDSIDANNPNRIIPKETIGKEEKRPQTGASNYIINAGIYYDAQPVAASLVYNYVTNRMYRPNAVYAASLFERPLESLDAQVAVRFLRQKAEVRLNASNLLNSFSVIYKNWYRNGKSTPDGDRAPTKRELMFNENDDEVNFRVRPGRTLGVTFSYNF